MSTMDGLEPRPIGAITVFDEIGTSVLNESDLPVDDVMEALSMQHAEMAALVQWTRSMRSAGRRGGFFERDIYTTPSHIWDVFRTAAFAVEHDDVVGGIYETTESLAFNRISIDCEDRDEENVWNQIMDDLDLDARIREMWKEEFCFCVDEETEGLTNHGWKRISEIREGDKFLCLNPENLDITWELPIALNQFDYDGLLHSWETERFSALTTSSHRWLIELRNGNRVFRDTNAVESSTTQLVLAGGIPLEFRDEPEFSNELVELIGWVVTEGHFQSYMSKDLAGVVVSQSRDANPECVERLRKLAIHFEEEGAQDGASISEYKYNYDLGKSSFYFGGSIGRLIRALAPDKQMTPAFLTNLTRDQAEILYETLMDGDGHRQKYDVGVTTRRWLGWKMSHQGVKNISPHVTERWSQKDQGRVDSFQMLAAMLGRRSRPGVHGGQKNVTVYKNCFAYAKAIHKSMIPYKGVVWCPTTPTGTWFARRNGITYWTGNSQATVATYWGQRSYSPKNKLPDQKRQRRKTFDNLNVPLGISVLDNTKVVPIGSLMFHQDMIAYAAMMPEADEINATIQGNRPNDALMSQLLLRPYEPSFVERQQLGMMGLPVERLYLMNPQRVFRHTTTRPAYKRFADVRLKTVFELLDMKNQLKQLDRAMLIGGINYLVLVKRGDKDRPASNAEVQDTDRRFRSIGRVPVIVGDHRLSVEIVAVKGDNTLSADRYDTIDSRIAIRLFSMFISNKQQAAARSDDSIKLARVIGRGLESRRHMLRRTIERKILKPIFDSNDQLTSPPTLRFHPNRVALDLDPALLQFILDIRDRGDMSRESTLEMVDLDEFTEARRREYEKSSGLDDIFQTQVPGAALAPGQQPGGTVPMSPRTAGRTMGGLKNGGGAGRRGRGPGPNAKPGQDGKPNPQDDSDGQ